MKRFKDRILAIWTLLLLMGIGSCAAQKHAVDYSFTFLDKRGLITGYEIQFVPATSTPLEKLQTERLFSETKQLARAYGREIMLSDFYFKRDSIEKQLANDIIKQMKKHQIEIQEVNILNLMLPKQIADALTERATVLKEPQPTRIKVVDR